METTNQYFARRDTPSAGSPVGITMVKVLEKYPELSFEEARAKAKELLSTAAGKRIYRAPRVLSAQELILRAERLKTAFPKAAEAQINALNAP